MGKIRSVLIGAAALCCPFLAGTSTAAGAALRAAAYWSAGAPPAAASAPAPESAAEPPGSLPESASMSSASPSPPQSAPSASESHTVSALSEAPRTADEPPAKLGRVITLDRPESTDDTDYSVFTENSGEILRYGFGKSKSAEYVTLPSGAQVRNCTELTNGELSEAAKTLPNLGELDGEQPAVLIYHTHTSESFLPCGDSFDADYPLRSGDPARNMTAVGDAVCESLSKRGVSVVHDCAVYDSPMFTGAYYRSADGMLSILEEYPSIKIALDIHRDGIINEDGSLVAPVAEIDGKNAAQFMIISGCDDGDMDMPDYIENFKLACLLQNCAEETYPGLARAVLFDYRNYNQGLSTGALLVEVGSHGNSLDEAVRTGELLGNIVADALEKAT